VRGMKRWSGEGRGRGNRVEFGCRDSGNEYLGLALWLYSVSSLVTLLVELPLHLSCPVLPFVSELPTHA
jgi:hypothetical protein